MAATVELKYFNTFLLKKVINNANYYAWWPNVTPAKTTPLGSATVTAFPGNAGTTYSADANFYVEEARITGGFNNTSVDFGVKAYITESNDEQDSFVSGLIHSGIYNSRTGINNTNQFSVGEAITRTLNPEHGSIQKLYAEDTNLITLQEDKSQRILIDKDTIYTTESGTQTQTAKQVLGQVVPYLGEYGISKNPQSFAVYGGRKYYADKNRNAILRLSRDGITEISQYGMFDFFRDNLAEISDDFQIYKITSTSVAGTGVTFDITTNGDLVEPGMQIHVNNNDTGIIVNSIAYNGVNDWTITASASLTVTTSTSFVKYVKDKIIGGWDIHNKNYVVSTQDALDETYNTVSFEDGANAWISFYSYKPNFAGSLKNHYYTFKDGAIWKQYDNNTTSTRANFYGVQYKSNITFIFNPQPSITKNFQTIAYEGSNGWEVESFVSDFEGLDYINNNYQDYNDSTNKIYSYLEGRYDSAVPPNTGIAATTQPFFQAGFDRKENKYVANLVSASAARPNEVIFGDIMSGIKGYFATVKISTDTVTDVGGLKELFAASTNFVPSSY